jgi:hypothetical protein
MSKIITIILAVATIFTLPACNSDDGSKKAQYNDAARVVWESVSGVYVREDSSQYNNAVLQMKYLSNNCVMFEFRLMEGSESEDSADTLVLPSVLLVDEDGVGRFESLPDSEQPFGINVALSEDGHRATVTHSGELSISPDGVYNFTDDSLEVSEVSAISILEHLPTAATSLNHNNGEYTIQYPDELVADWFYPVQAVFCDSGAVLAKFLIAKDLSAVYRADDDIEPVLIFGSAQPMLDAETIPLHNGVSEGEETAEWADETMPIVGAVIVDGVHLAVGQESRLTVMMPWKLPHTLTAESSDPSVVDVDKNGVVKAVSAGEATISGTIAVDDGEKKFSIKVSVAKEKETVQTEVQ